MAANPTFASLPSAPSSANAKLPLMLISEFNDCCSVANASKRPQLSREASFALPAARCSPVSSQHVGAGFPDGRKPPPGGKGGLPSQNFCEIWSRFERRAGRRDRSALLTPDRKSVGQVVLLEVVLLVVGRLLRDAVLFGWRLGPRSLSPGFDLRQIRRRLGLNSL